MSERIYDIDGKKLPSVTTILGILNKPAIMPWAVKMTAECYEDEMHNFYDPLACQFIVPDTALPIMTAKAKKAYRTKSTEAMDIGTKVHDAIQNWIESDGKMQPEEIADEQIRAGLEGFLAWGNEHEVEIISFEQVVSNGSTYAGRYDLLARVDGKLTLIDFKTSTGIWDEYWLQTAAYAAALQPEIKEPIEVIAILRIDKHTGQIEYESKEEWAMHAVAFNTLANFYQLNKQLKG